MERFLKWLDDFDDAMAVVRAHLPSIMITLALLAGFLLAVAAAFLFGPPTLQAAP
jgi:uncharacterized membrane protein YdjX (TVP38/TMEM64 family)